MLAHVLLTVIILTAGDSPDIRQDHPMASMDECMAAARAWVDQDVRAAGKGVAGFAAGCAISYAPTQDAGEPQ